MTGAPRPRRSAAPAEQETLSFAEFLTEAPAAEPEAPEPEALAPAQPPADDLLRAGASLPSEPPRAGRSLPSEPPRTTPATVPRIASDLPGPRIHSVGEVTRLVRDAVRTEPRLRNVWVEGEVGQFSVSSAGHSYFTLKDERAQLRCMIFRDDRIVMPFEPRTGLRLIAHGRLDVFEPQGHYQLYVDTIQPAGFGDLAIRFEALKAQLSAEGLFDANRKRQLPEWPRTIGIATSLSGAVLHDMRKVLARRWPLVRVVVAACQVQGPGAAQMVVAALRRLGRWTDPVSGRGTDLVILARGGGSLEDLWAFNEESVVRAVAAHPCPIVMGVGHETDVTLAEFAADVRAATPSVAAELAVPNRADQVARLGVLNGRLVSAARRTLAGPRQLLDGEARALDACRPTAYLAAERERIGLLLDRASRAVEGRLEVDRGRLRRADDRLPLLLQGRLARGRTELGRAGAGLGALSPFATLERGYAIVRDADGAIVREARALEAGDPLQVRVALGEIDARVERVRDSAP